jgi:hypothetical protein
LNLNVTICCEMSSDIYVWRGTRGVLSYAVAKLPLSNCPHIFDLPKNNSFQFSLHNCEVPSCKCEEEKETWCFSCTALAQIHWLSSTALQVIISSVRLWELTGLLDLSVAKCQVESGTLTLPFWVPCAVLLALPFLTTALALAPGFGPCVYPHC